LLLNSVEVNDATDAIVTCTDEQASFPALRFRGHEHGRQ
jgi:hypothetical protein